MKVLTFGIGGDIGRHFFEYAAEHGHRSLGFTREVCDVTSTADIQENLAWEWGRTGGIDGLVLAFGAPGCIRPTVELLDDEFLNVLNIDLVGAFRVCREFKRYASPGASIVVVSSMHAIATYPQRAAYAAAKAGVCGLVRALAVEWAPQGVRVNAVLPGQVEGTRRTQRLQDDAGAIRTRSPSGGPVSLESVSKAILYLLEAPGVTGHSLVVDGGWTASAWFKGHGQP